MFKSLCPPPGAYFCVWNGLWKDDWHCDCFKQPTGIMARLRSLNVHLWSASHLLQLGQKKHTWKQRKKENISLKKGRKSLLYHSAFILVLRRAKWIPVTMVNDVFGLQSLFILLLLFPERKGSAQGFLSLEPRQDYVHSVCPRLLPEIFQTARKMFTILALSLLCC